MVAISLSELALFLSIDNNELSLKFEWLKSCAKKSKKSVQNAR